MVFADQDNAYPRVRWDFLQKVMKRMDIPAEFRKMTDQLYAAPLIHTKINGHIGQAWSPKHGEIGNLPVSL